MTRAEMKEHIGTIVDPETGEEEAYYYLPDTGDFMIWRDEDTQAVILRSREARHLRALEAAWVAYQRDGHYTAANAAEITRRAMTARMIERDSMERAALRHRARQSVSRPRCGGQIIADILSVPVVGARFLTWYGDEALVEAHSPDGCTRLYICDLLWWSEERADLVEHSALNAPRLKSANALPNHWLLALWYDGQDYDRAGLHPNSAASAYLTIDEALLRRGWSAARLPDYRWKFENKRASKTHS